MAKQYTLVLVQTPNGCVLINRAKPPYIGLWNALGGKIEANETPQAGAIREVQEESGLNLKQIHACGLVHWYVDDQLRGDLHLFAATTDAQVAPKMTREGVLAAWPRRWVEDVDNLGLVPDLPAMLPLFKAGVFREYVSRFVGERFVDLTVAL